MKMIPFSDSSKDKKYLIAETKVKAPSIPVMKRIQSKEKSIKNKKRKNYKEEFSKFLNKPIIQNTTNKIELSKTNQ